MVEFPAYAIRSHQRIFEEGEFVVVQTHRNRYVLDYVNKEGEYKSRRIQMLKDELPYPMYPLKDKHLTLSTLINSKKRTFIDRYGKIITWKPQKFYPVVCVKVKSSWTTRDGQTMLDVGHTKFKVKRGFYKYVQVVQVGEKWLLYGTSDIMLPTTRKKI